jgi:hypothetical protein
MSPSHPRRNVLAEPVEDTKPLSSRYDYAMYMEFSFVRREAQAEADMAYEEWRFDSSTDAYIVYRAAQDRADAAQDALAVWASRIAA